MSYVLSVIHPPTAPAAFGQARVVGKAVTPELAADMLVRSVSTEAQIPEDDRPEIARKLLSARMPSGWSLYLTGPGREGWRLRVDHADNAPHPCPCCERLVLPEDHADAHLDDAYCLGCFTWKRDVPGCLPANSAHTEEP